MKGAATLLLLTTAGTVVAAAGPENPDKAMAEATARFLRDRGGDDPPQELLVTTADRYWLARPLGNGSHLLLLALDRHRANLGRAQLDLMELERGLAEKLGKNTD